MAATCMLALGAAGHYILGYCHYGALKGLGLRMCSIIELVASVIMLYFWMILIQVVMSWLVVFNVINTQNRFVFMVGDFLHKITEPALGPIRRILPSLGGIDLSPVVLILILIFLQNFLREITGCGPGF